MTYPDALLPKSSYKKCIDANDLVLHACYLIRRSLKTQEETLDNIGQVRIDAICEIGNDEALYGLSHNVLGVFTKEHLKYSVHHKINIEWVCSVEDIEPLSNDRFGIFDSFVPLYVSIPSIHNRKFPHRRVIKNKSTDTSVDGSCLVVHKPNLYNYWHFELQFLDCENNPIKKSGATWRVDAAKNFIKNILLEFVSVEAPVDSNIPSEIYKK